MMPPDLCNPLSMALLSNTANGETPLLDSVWTKRSLKGLPYTMSAKLSLKVQLSQSMKRTTTPSCRQLKMKQRLLSWLQMLSNPSLHPNPEPSTLGSNKRTKMMPWKKMTMRTLKWKRIMLNPPPTSASLIACLTTRHLMQWHSRSLLPKNSQ